MKKINFRVLNKLVAILILASALIFHPRFLRAQSSNFDFDKEFEKTAQLIVMLKAGDEGSPEFGAGIVFGREKDRLLIATAHHILRSAGQPANIKVQFRSMPPDKYVVAKLLRYDKESGKDIAVLSVENPQKQGIDACALPFNRLGKVDNIKRGDSVFSVGNPNGISWAIPVAADRISQIRGDEIVFQSSFISPGHSGGGLLDARGNLIGMITADQPPFGRAINLGAILRLVKQWGYPVQSDTVLSENRTPLHMAAFKGDLVAIKSHLTDCGNPNARDDHNASPLHYAALQGSVDAVSLLLKAGANPDLQDGDGDPPLEWAIAKGHLESVKLLVQKGANLDIINNEKETVLYRAIRLEQPAIAIFLIQAGANVNIKVKYLETPLSMAVRKNQIEVVRTLIKYGAKVRGYDRRYNGYNAPDPPVYLAVRENDLEMLKVLLKAGADPEERTNYPHLAPIHLAIQKINLEAIKILASAGANLNSQFFGETALNYALGYSETIANFLIKAGANVNAQDSTGKKAALHVGAKYKKPNIITTLLKAGANLNVQDEEGLTPLHYAVRGAYSETESLKILLEAGANPNIKNKVGETPLAYAYENSGTNGDAVKSLLNKYGGK